MPPIRPLASSSRSFQWDARWKKARIAQGRLLAVQANAAWPQSSVAENFVVGAELRPAGQPRGLFPTSRRLMAEAL